MRRFSTGGVIITVAGTGVAGYSGDNGAAAAAQLNNPTTLALDAAAGLLYIVDSGNHAIRVVTLSDSQANPTRAKGSSVIRSSRPASSK